MDKTKLAPLFGALMAVGTVTAAQAHEFYNNASIWGTLTYTRASNNGESMGSETFGPDSGNALNGNQETIFIDPDHEFDYGLGFSYRLGHRTHFFVSYDHFRDGTNKNEDDITNLGFVPNVEYDNDDLTNFFINGDDTFAFGRTEHHSEEVRIGFFHKLPVSRHFTMGLSGFFEYDRVTRHIYETINQNINFNDDDDINFDYPGFGSLEINESVQGWGPGVGAMAHFRPLKRYPCWGVFAGFKSILLYTNNNYDEDAFSNFVIETNGRRDGFQDIVVDQINVSGVSTSFIDYDPQESHSFVGKVEINFGIDYSKPFRSGMGRLGYDIALGMRYMNMFNLFKNGNANLTTVFPDGVINTTGLTGVANDFGRFGPYLQVKIGGVPA